MPNHEGKDFTNNYEEGKKWSKKLREKWAFWSSKDGKKTLQQMAENFESINNLLKKYEGNLPESTEISPEIDKQEFQKNKDIIEKIKHGLQDSKLEESVYVYFNLDAQYFDEDIQELYDHLKLKQGVANKIKNKIMQNNIRKHHGFIWSSLQEYAHRPNLLSEILVKMKVPKNTEVGSMSTIFADESLGKEEFEIGLLINYGYQIQYDHDIKIINHEHDWGKEIIKIKAKLQLNSK